MTGGGSKYCLAEVHYCMKRKKIFAKSAKFAMGLILLLYTIFPVYWLAAMSVRPMDEMKGHISLIPKSLTVEHFVRLFTEKGFSRALVNSLQVSGISLAVSLVFGLCEAYCM